MSFLEFDSRQVRAKLVEALGKEEEVEARGGQSLSETRLATSHDVDTSTLR